MPSDSTLSTGENNVRQEVVLSLSGWFVIKFSRVCKEIRMKEMETIYFLAIWCDLVNVIIDLVRCSWWKCKLSPQKIVAKQNGFDFIVIRCVRCEVFVLAEFYENQFDKSINDLGLTTANKRNKTQFASTIKWILRISIESRW